MWKNQQGQLNPFEWKFVNFDLQDKNEKKYSISKTK